jgi:hypothetical protein
LGKLASCGVLAEHPTVSRRHAALVACAAHGPCVVDLGTANGTFLGGVALQPFAPTPLVGAAGGGVVAAAAAPLPSLVLARSSRSYACALSTDAKARRAAALQTQVDLRRGGQPRVFFSPGRGQEILLFSYFYVIQKSHTHTPTRVRRFFGQVTSQAAAVAAQAPPGASASGRGAGGDASGGCGQATEHTAFLANLPFTVTEASLRAWLVETNPQLKPQHIARVRPRFTFGVFFPFFCLFLLYLFFLFLYLLYLYLLYLYLSLSVSVSLCIS